MMSQRIDDPLVDLGIYIGVVASCGILLAVAILVASGAALAQDGHTEITANITRLIDADTAVCDVTMTAEAGENLYWNVRVKERPITVTLLDQRLRVHGVDAHEASTDKGKIAKLSVEKLLVGKRVELTPRGKDNFGRLLAIVTLVDEHGNKIVLADWLIKNNHGVAFRPR